MNEHTKTTISRVAEEWYARQPESLPPMQRTSAHFFVHHAIKRIAKGGTMLEAAKEARALFDDDADAWREKYWLQLNIGSLGWPYNTDYLREAEELRKKSNAWRYAQRMMQEWLEALQAYAESGDGDEA